MRELAPIFSALFYLRACSLRNMLRSNLRRLKQPSYLLGVLLAVGYFWLVFFARHDGPGLQRLPQNFEANGMVELLGSSALLIYVLGMWMLPSEKPGLRFTEAEVAFLFTAPLPRRQLIHYKLLSNVLATLVGALFFTVLSSGSSRGWGGALQHLLAWWLLTTNLSLHSMAVALTLSKFSGLGSRKILRRCLLAVLTISLVALAGYLFVSGQRELLRQVLLPGRLLIQPFLLTGEGYWLSLLPLLLLLALHYRWVLMMESPFEEASIAQATRQAAFVSRVRAGKGIRFSSQEKSRKAPFVLRAWMPIELAIYWKNLMLAPAYLNRKTFLVVSVLVIVAMQWLSQKTQAPFDKFDTGLAGIAGMLLIYLLMFGPIVARIDLRSDLGHCDMLKAWPWPGWRVVLGSLLAPAVLLTGIAWVLLLTVVLGLTADIVSHVDALQRAAMAGSFALLLPLLFMLQLLAPNAMALVFPAWLRAQRTNQRGMEMAGLQFVLMIAQFLLFIIALLPVLFVASIVVYLGQWFGNLALTWSVALVAMIVVLLLEVLYGVYLLGERFEQLDVASDMR